mmetsp:Transcript_28809/g.72359  ORF Transcript_28809/g.72359 Transcript_28809/m.72359 type:complete len:363 (-) Transcript_28809:12-1100(-)
MDVLTRSLNLLPERLERFAHELAEVRSQVSDLQRSSAEKANAQDVGRLKEQLSKLTSTVVKKIEVAETEHFNHFNSQFQALNAAAANKADGLEVERLGQELLRLVDASDKSFSRLEDLEARLQSLADSASSRAQLRLEEALVRIEAVKEGLEGKVAEQQGKLRELSTKLLAQSEGPVLDQLNFQYRTLSTTLSQKVDWADMEHVKNQLNMLSHSVVDKAEASVAEHFQAPYRAMCAAASRAARASGADPREEDAVECPAKGFPPLEKPFVAGLDAVSKQLKALGQAVELKADRQRVDQLVEQFQLLADLLAPKLSPKPQPPKNRPVRPQSARASRPSMAGSRASSWRTDCAAKPPVAAREGL